jgi:peptidoglycan/LPS O-acetylase OafA/YrhL
MTMAWAFVRLRERPDRERIARAAPYAAALGLVGIAACAYFAGRYAIDTPSASVLFLAFGDSSNVIAYTIALSVFMLALTFCAERLQTPFTNPVARRVADLSYPIYLSHAVVLWVIAAEFAVPRNGSLSSFLIMLSAVIPISIGYGYLSTRFVEQPARRWGQRYGRREQARRAGEPAATKEPTPASPAG